jgi:UDP-glucose 4-epimerase
MRPARVLVTGSRGYLGGRISAFLQETNRFTLRLASRALPGAAEHRAVDLVAIGELTTPEMLDAACQGVSYVVHLAALNEIDSEREPERAVEVNVSGTLRLAQAARRAGVERFLYLSTAHVYGAPLAGCIDEGRPTRPVHPYAITHRAAEDFVLGESSRSSMAAVIIRLSNSVGAPASASVERWTLLVNDLCRQIVSDRRMVLRSAGLQQRDFIPMSDVCRAIGHFLDLPSQRLGDGLFNLGGGRSLRVIEVAERLAERSERVLGFAPPISRPAPPEDERTEILDYRIDKLLASGFTPTGDLDQELDDTLRFCRAAFGGEHRVRARPATPPAHGHA